MFEFASSKLTKIMGIVSAIVALLGVIVQPSVGTAFALLGWVLVVLLAYVNQVREEQVETLVSALEERGYDVEVVD